MSHLDDEAVASLAVGDDQDAVAALHAAQCPDCEQRVEHMRALADRIGAIGRHTGLMTPPDHLWEQIASELGDELLADLPAASPQPLSAVGEVPANPGGASGAADDPRAADEAASVDLTARRAARDDLAAASAADGDAVSRGRRTPWLVGIAAGLVGLVAGAGIVAGVLRNPEPTGSVVAQANLTNLLTEADAGTARVEVLGDGSSVLVLDTDFEDVPDAYLEVWLIDPNIEGMVSLGHLTQADEQFVIPAGFDVADFPIVDISVEPLDGVPTHSGDSVTRGVLEQ